MPDLNHLPPFRLQKAADGSHTILCLHCGYRTSDPTAEGAIQALVTDHKCNWKDAKRK